MTGDGFTPIHKFSKKLVSMFSFYTYMQGLDHAMRKIYMGHNLMRISDMTESEILAMNEWQMLQATTRCSIEGLAIMQPDSSVVERAHLAKEMTYTMIGLHAKWIMVTRAVLIEKVISFLVVKDPYGQNTEGMATVSGGATSSLGPHRRGW